MANLHFRVPVTLDVRLDVDDPVARVHKWRTWPDTKCPQAEDLLLRFEIGKFAYVVVGYFDGGYFFDSSHRFLFEEDDASLAEYDQGEIIFHAPTPNVIHWIPLDELLEGVEDAEVEEQA